MTNDDNLEQIVRLLTTATRKLNADPGSDPQLALHTNDLAITAAAILGHIPPIDDLADGTPTDCIRNANQLLATVEHTPTSDPGLTQTRLQLLTELTIDLSDLVTELDHAEGQ